MRLVTLLFTGILLVLCGCSSSEHHADVEFLQALSPDVPQGDREIISHMLKVYNRNLEYRNQIPSCFNNGRNRGNAANVKCSWAPTTSLDGLLETVGMKFATPVAQLRPGYVMVPYLDRNSKLHFAWMEKEDAQDRRYDEYLDAMKETE